MFARLSIAMLLAAVPALAHGAPPAAKGRVEMTAAVFEMFRLVPGKVEAFIRDAALWDQVSAAGGQPPSQLFVHSGGEGWDVLLYKPSRPKPTPAQDAAMAAKAKAMGLPSGKRYFVSVREQMADHVHFDAEGPMTAADWVAGLDRERAEAGSAR